MRHLNKTETTGLIACYLTLAVTVGASFVSGDSWWGIALWKFLPRAMMYPIVSVAVIAPIGVLFLFSRNSFSNHSSGSRNKALLGWAVSVTLAMALFWFLRVRIHLLGDGYALLNFLADSGAHPFIKDREIGEGLLHLWVRSFWLSVGGVNIKDAALLSFQTISVASGALAFTAIFFLTRRLFERRAERLIFGAGLLSGGYALLFFGYVENYSVFAAAVIAFTLVGLVSLKHRRLLIFTITLAALATWLHILGVTLVLALCYALVSGTPLAKRVSRLRPLYIVSAVFIITAIVGYLFWRLYTTNLFFQFAFLHLTDTRFDISGYTLFSATHLTDLLNLFFVLCPWFGLAVVGLFFKQVRSSLVKAWRLPEVRFLTILSLSALGAVFVLDPKLGLGRDWDLFAFSAIPLTTLFFYTGLKSAPENSGGLRWFLLFAILLNVITLSARVSVLNSKSSSIDSYKSLIAGTPRRLHSAVQNLQDYYFANGDSTSAITFANQYAGSFPEVALVKVSLKLSRKQSFRKAIELCRQALTLNPQYSAAYANIGFNYVLLGEYDSALTYLEIADGLNPYNSTTHETIGIARLQLGNKRGASEILHNLLKRNDSLSVRGLGALMRIAADNGDMPEYHSLLKRMVRHRDAPPVAFVQLGDYYVSQRKYRLAYDAYIRSVAHGADSSALQSFTEKYGDFSR